MERTEKVGKSEILLNLASPPLMVSRVTEMESLVISASWSVYLFLFPGFRTTTLSFWSYLKIYPHLLSSPTFSHMNLNLIPLSNLLSNLELSSTKWFLTLSEGFYLVSRITQRVDSVPKQISLALFSYISGTKIKENSTYFGHPLLRGRRIQGTASSRHEHF